mmetsp:Transcript_42058/g.136105  ORF Transcript_42058/g.136105 Transcript_42058/m.136105 type:complete len:213 (-) Transcript_42058:989-1627(-)
MQEIPRAPLLVTVVRQLVGVLAIRHSGMPDVLQMHADLVGAASSDNDCNQGDLLFSRTFALEDTDRLDLCPCRFTLVAHGAGCGESLRSLDLCVDDPRTPAHATVTEHQVLAAELVRILLPAQGVVADKVLARQDESRTRRIQPVDNAELLLVAVHERVHLAREPPAQEAREQRCTRRVSWERPTGASVDFPMWRLEHHHDAGEVEDDARNF